MDPLDIEAIPHFKSDIKKVLIYIKLYFLLKLV